jgi:hypothetical protein
VVRHRHVRRHVRVIFGPKTILYKTLFHEAFFRYRTRFYVWSGPGPKSGPTATFSKMRFLPVFVSRNRSVFDLLLTLFGNFVVAGPGLLYELGLDQCLDAARGFGLVRLAIE